MLLLWLATIIQPECDKSTEVCQPTTPLQLTLLYSFFTLTSIGAGGVRSSCLAFAADQLQLNTTSRTATSALETLFNWYYCSIMLAYFLSQSFLVFIQTKYGWQIGFGVSVVAMALSVAWSSWLLRFMSSLSVSPVSFLDFSRFSLLHLETDTLICHRRSILYRTIMKQDLHVQFLARNWGLLIYPLLLPI